MTQERLRQYPQTIVLRLDTQKRINRLKKEIAVIEKRMTSRKHTRDAQGNLVDLATIKEERLQAEERLLAELDKKTLEVENLIASATDLTPLETIIMTKLYIEGLTWKEVIETLQEDPEYRKFYYERTTYMRAHKQALKKLNVVR